MIICMRLEEAAFFIYFDGSDAMAKLMVIPSCYNDIDKLIESVDAIVVGIKDLSVNFLEIETALLSKLVETVHSKSKKIFISLNKNMHNSDLKKVSDILIECERLNVDGIFYYDVAVLKMHQKLELKVPLIWSAEHLVTNYNTINYWAKFGVSYAFLSNELTKVEIEEINRNTTIPLILQVFGYVPMYVSKRHAINNYLKHFNLKTNSSEFLIFKEGYKYPILERRDNTEIYSHFILNSIDEYLDIKPEYVLLNGFKIDADKFLEVINLFSTVTQDNKLEFKERIDSMFNNTGLGFMYKEAIYQVKKNDK